MARLTGCLIGSTRAPRADSHRWPAVRLGVVAVRPAPTAGGTRPLWDSSPLLPDAAFPGPIAVVRDCARIPRRASPLRPARSGWLDARWRSAHSGTPYRYAPWIRFDCTSSERRRDSHDPP